MAKTENWCFEERLTSNRTEGLFFTLTALFGGLFAWLRKVKTNRWLSGTSLFAFLVFLFYSINFRTLVVHLSPRTLTLTFGLFKWSIPIENIDYCAIDDVPAFKRFGGAGVHFMSVRGRYRASFNFLEYPRVLIQFKTPVGPVRDISFSTRQPEEVIRLIRDEISASAAA